MRVADAVGIPLLILNAADDPVCTLANVKEHRGLFTRVPESLLVLTARGSHCAFFEGPWRARSWAHRLMAEYFAAVQVAEKGESASLLPRSLAVPSERVRRSSATHPRSLSRA
jgi:predicted alpha/beta-fold hydrolase